MATPASLIKEESIIRLIADVKQLQARCTSLEDDNKGLKERLAAAEKHEGFQLVSHDHASGKYAAHFECTLADVGDHNR